MSFASWFRAAFDTPHPLESVFDGSLSRPTLENIAARKRDKPRLAAVRAAPSRDEFRAWRDDLTTQFVMAALTRNAEECREAWLEESWGKGNPDEVLLIAMRERSDALLGFTASYEAFCETLGLEPEPEEENAER